MRLTGVVPRRVSEVLMDQVRVEPVVALHGPRSVGKSTVLRAFAAQAGSTVIDLDDIEVREAVEGNLASAVSTARTGPPPRITCVYWRICFWSCGCLPGARRCAPG